MKYIKTYEKEYHFGEKYWLIPIEFPYYMSAIEILGVSDNELDDWKDINNNIRNDDDVNKDDDYILFFINENYYDKKIQYSWGGISNFQIYKDSDYQYMGKITIEKLENEYKDIVDKYKMMANINKYNL